MATWPPKELHRLSKELLAKIEDYWKNLRLQEDLDRLASIEERTKNPHFWDNPDEARKINQQRNDLSVKVEPWLQLRSEVKDFPDLIDLTIEEMGEEGLVSLNQDWERLQGLLEELEIGQALSGEEDKFNCYLNIHPGAGGTESQDWAEMLYRMYTRYFEKKGYRVQVMDEQEGETAGIKNVTLYIQGEKAFGYLKGESGVHRLVRISPFDSNKRRHTSFASVHVTPELDDTINIVIEDKDLRVDVYRSSGAGGQHVNTTDSAVRMTHIPTNTVVSCQNERSQIKNRETAMKMLKAKLYEIERLKAEEELAKKSGEKREIGWGSQIRSYVFHPYNLVKDHRNDFETSNVHGVMDGDVEPFIMAYLKSFLHSKVT